MRHRSTAVLLALTLAVALTPLTSAGADVHEPAQGERCHDAPAGTVTDQQAQTTTDYPQADIVEYCITYTTEVFELRVRVAQPVDPMTDDNWTQPTGIEWDINTDEDPFHPVSEYRASFFRGPAGGPLRTIVSDQDSPRHCEGDASFDGTWYTASYHGDCLWGAPQAGVNVAITYHHSPDEYALDRHPGQDGHTGPVHRTGEDPPPTCFDDPVGDTVRWDDSQMTFVDENAPQSDIRQVCAVYGNDLHLALTAAEPRDPATDAGWQGGTAEAMWTIDSTGDGQADYHVSYRVRHGALSVEVQRSDAGVPVGEVVCEGEPRFAGGAYEATIPARCIASPTAFNLQGDLVYPADQEGDYYTDRAPEHGQPWPQVSRGGAAQPVGPAFDGDPTTTQRVDRSEPVGAATAISQMRFQAGQASHAVLGRSNEFADSLAGSALTGDGPLLLTPSATLDSAARAELDRVLAPGARVYLLGGVAALSQQVEDELAAAGYDVRRLQGPTRVETALEVAREVRARNPGEQRVAVARADIWADSITFGAWAARHQVPLVLTQSDQLHPAVAAFLDEAPVSETLLLGGHAALSAQVEQSVPNPRRIAGPTRDETAAAIADLLWGGTPTRFTVINGWDDLGWAFGLAGGGLAADHEAPLLLGQRDSVPPSTAQRAGFCDNPGVDVLVIGGATLIGEQALASFGSC